jgi:hypothetical protein
MTGVDSREISGGELSQWDELVIRSPQGTIFHTNSWLDACSEYGGKKVRIFGCFKDDTLIGGCSLFVGKKWGVMSYAESNSGFSPYGGFVLSSPPAQGVHKQETFSRQIVESLLECIKKEHYVSIVISNSPEFQDIRPFISGGWKSRVQYTYYFDLGVNIEAHIDTRLKKTMRRAEKERLVFEPSSDIAKFYSLLCQTYARKKLQPAASERFIADISSFVRDQDCGELVVARTPEGEVACAEMVVWDTKRAYRWAAASDERFKDTGASSLLLFTVLKRLQERGIRTINLMGANTFQLSQFLARFNPALVPYYPVSSSIFDDINL